MEVKKQIELMFKEKQQTNVALSVSPKINRTGANYFVCIFEGCGATIKHRRNLIRHWQLHQKAKYYCSNCGILYISREQITQHNCEPETPKFNCDECDKKFTVLQHLNRHLLLIHGHRLFVWCPTCRSYFARIDALKKHQSRCHQSDNLCSTLLGTNRVETIRSKPSITFINTPTITSVSKIKSKSLSNLSTISDKGINLIINQQNNQLSTIKRDGTENQFLANNISSNSNKTSNIINNCSFNQKNLNENLIKTQPSLTNKNSNISENNSVGSTLVNNLSLVRNSVISRASASNMVIMNLEDQCTPTLNNNYNRMKFLNNNIMLNNSKIQSFSSSNEREEYLYRNKKIRFNELVERDRLFKN